MKTDKEKAIRLRKCGKSYSQINQLLGTPKSTLSYWLKNIKIAKKLQENINNRARKASIDSLIKRNKQQTELAKARAEKIYNQAKNEAVIHISNPLFVSGINLYWAEGYKKGAYGSKWKAVDFANSDPEMIKVILKFFTEFCNIQKSKFKIQIIAHSNLNINKAVKYWSRLSSVPENQFIRTYCAVSKPGKNKRNKNSLKHGTVHIRIHDVKLFFRIIGWIDGLKENILKGAA